MQPTERIQPLYTLPELSRVLRHSRPKILQMIKDGSIPAMRCGRAWRFDIQAVLQAMAVTANK